QGEFARAGRLRRQCLRGRLWRRRDRVSDSRSQSAVEAVVFMHDDKRLGSVSNDGTVRVWSVRTREPLHTFDDIGRGQILSTTASGRGLFVASVGGRDARMFALSPMLDMTPIARREYVCERSLIGAHSFLAKEMDDIILQGREELRDPCRQRGALRPEYYAQ